MEINLKKLSTQASESTTGVKRMRLSENATSMVFQMFTKSIYSNPIGTVVREITSNCFDSHIEANVNVPVIIKLWKDNQDNSRYVSFIDFGVGMSPDRIENIYGTYFESTKRGDNTQIGGFGIGGKTPLAYKRSTGHGEGEYDNGYYVITIYNGIKYSYYIYEGEEAPEWSLLHQEETKEHNGTEIRVPVLDRDVTTFKKEMVRQLYYFENIVFEGFDGTDDDYYGRRYEETLTNQYSIVRGKTFWFRGTEYSDVMHVCLGRVSYPIDYNVLGLNASDYRLPIAIKLEVGDINVTASRETLDYNENTIKVLKKKLEEAKAEITSLLAKQYSNIVTLEDYFLVKNDFGTLHFANGSSIRVGNLIAQKDIDFSNFRYSFLKMPNDKQLFRFFFEVKSYGKKPSRSRYSSKYEFEGGYEELKQNNNLLYVDGEFVRKVVKQAYLKSLHDLYHIISPRDITSAFIRSEIAEIFNVHMDKLVDDNGKPLPFVQSLIDMQEEYFTIVQKHASDYDKLEVPEDFIASRKKKNGLSEELRNTTIPVKYMGSYGKQRTKLNDLFNYNMPIFYATQENEGLLNRIYRIYTTLFDEKSVAHYDEYHKAFETGYDSYSYKKGANDKPKKSIMFIVLSTANVKYMEYCKKAYKPEEFMNKLLYRKEDAIMQYFQTYNLKEKWNDINNIYKSKDFGKISDKWAKKIADVSKFIGNVQTGKKDFGYVKDELSKYFDLTNIEMTPEQKKISKTLAEIEKLQKNNEEVFEYVRTPYSTDSFNSKLVEILQKVMVL